MGRLGYQAPHNLYPKRSHRARLGTPNNTPHAVASQHRGDPEQSSFSPTAKRSE